MIKKTNISRISRFTGLRCAELRPSAAFELPKILVDLVDLAQFLELFKRSQTNHAPRTENKFLFFNFINNVQATSDRVQANNSQAKRGAVINFFYS